MARALKTTVDGWCWSDALRDADAALVADFHGGLTTAVVVEVRENCLHGASVGASGAWTISESGIFDLTAGQLRKPLVGSGAAQSVAFGPVSLSMIPDFTAKVGVPRLAGIAYPMGRPLGRPGDAEGQRAVLQSVLDVLRTATTPNTYVELPFTWPESIAQARKASHEPPPIAKLLQRKPWLLPRLYGGDIPQDER